jgi:peptidyl-dipeptidase A
MTEAPKAAEALVAEAEARLLDLSIEAQRAAWVYETYINEDTEQLTAKADARLSGAALDLAKRAGPLADPSLPAELRRRLDLLRLSQALLAPGDPTESEELARHVASMRGRYAKGRHTPPGRSESLDLNALNRRLSESRDPAELLDLWLGWHTVGRPMRAEFARYVELANRGAREVGFADTGVMWQSKYDMPPAAFVAETERLWEQVRPLYRKLHAYVRTRLVGRYGPSVVAPREAIPAHLLGNMWAQSWDALYPELAPPGLERGYDLSAILKAKKVDERELVRIAERFFISLGFEPLPATFWERSMFVRPPGREVLCHASAWDVDFEDDLRIKMCIEVTGEEFHVVHHELGHNFYQRAYRAQPFLYRDSANDGFHEAVGDTLGLSVTPEYLARIGLLETVPPAEADIGLLLRTALEKVAFLPFGLLVDRWRWEVFSGSLPPERWNAGWWAMRRRYQGVAPPGPRSEEDFDPGAKAHIPSSTPYMRYFLAAILQFQFHRALAREAGWTGPLHRFSIYGHRRAGERLRTMFAMGASRPWPEALEALTGERTMDASAILEYFRPLEGWLDAAITGSPIGWPGDGVDGPGPTPASR